MSDLIQWMPAIVSLQGLTVLLFVLVAVGGITTVIMFSVSRQVAIYKHPDWKFGDAVAFTLVRGIASLGVFALAMAATWVGPQLIGMGGSKNDVVFAQLAATAAVAVGMNIYWYGFVLARIARAP